MIHLDIDMELELLWINIDNNEVFNNGSFSDLHIPYDLVNILEATGIPIKVEYLG